MDNPKELKNTAGTADEQLEDFGAIRLGIASPEEILSWSFGEVTKPETINYRTQKPEKNGLFAENIFGPTKDWECYCGKYKRIRYKGIICDRCGVEVTRSIVRRERMGHISLQAPVTHIWYLRGVPSRIGLALDLSIKDLENVVYFGSYIITEVSKPEQEKAIKKQEAEKETEKKQIENETKDEIAKLKESFKKEVAKKKTTAEQKKELEEQLKRAEAELEVEKKKKIAEVEEDIQKIIDDLKVLAPFKLIPEDKYQELIYDFEDVFKANIGAEAIAGLLEKLDIDAEIKKLKTEMPDSTGQRRKKVIKRLRLLESFKRTKRKPEWMILTSLPVIPPDLRPMVQLDGGRFATADLNDLYRRVINRNNRLKRLMEIGAPEIIKRNEKRMLQEAVDALIDNSARRSGAVSVGANRRKLRSLSDILRGKQGRFRQNLLGKRVDYSGRSVIVVGPDLNLNQCGLPKKMALELFKPFVISELIKDGLAHNVKSATRMIEKGKSEVWDALDKIIEQYLVLLNRAPTLHRLGIQAFKPVLIEGNAIQIHPLVCSAFNADFDGDQMAVHVPLSKEAQKEAREIMLSSINLLKPADGTPITIASQDIVLGCYYITRTKEGAKGEGKSFIDEKEALMAYQLGKIHIQAPIKVRIDGKLLETSAGRIIFNQTLPPELGFVNELMTNKTLKELVLNCYFKYGQAKTAILVDSIKKIGFRYATISGTSFSINDIEVPLEKTKILDEADKETEDIRLQYKSGLLTDYEKYLRTLEVWMSAGDKVEEAMKNELNKYGPIYTLVDSGARGSIGQVTQLAGMKGLVVNPSGDIIELPIKSNFKEGFGVLEYFISTHGARKGKSDTALRTSDSGYLTRRLVDVAQDIIISEEDCKDKEGFIINKEESEREGTSFNDRLIGRFVIGSVVDKKGKTIIANDTEITRDQAALIEQAGIEDVKVRSVLTCKTSWGICKKCYGRNLARGTTVNLGEPVGIVAAQSIGEPGTQLTMQTFHRGGVAGEDITQGLPRVEEIFEVRIPKAAAQLSEVSGICSIEDQAGKRVIKINGQKESTKTIKIKKGIKVLVKEGDKVKVSDIIAKTKDKEVKSGVAGKIGKISDDKVTVIYNDNFEQKYTVPLASVLMIKNGEKIEKGDQINEGPLDLQKLLELKGPEAVQQYIIAEVQKIYASQGPTIADKHLEIIVKRMFSKVRIKEPGNTEYLTGEVIDKKLAEEINADMKKKGKKGATVDPLLLGITKASLLTPSFLSAASFQETTRILVTAAVEGLVDDLKGLKENVIIGRLIPAGTGYKK